MTPDYDKLVDCAAILMPNGTVWTGKRHHHCFKTAEQAYGKPEYNRLRLMGIQQGFVMMSGRYVSREEARKTVEETGQIKQFGHPTLLFSEDLY